MAAPVATVTAAPLRVSRNPSKNDVVMDFDLAWTDGPLRYWQTRFGGTLRTNGTRLDHLGIVCGLGNRCGMPGAMPLGIAGSTIDYPDNALADIDDLMPSDGDYRLGVDTLDNNSAWSATT